jgi:Ni/Co efflux regulator RcnB
VGLHSGNSMRHPRLVLALAASVVLCGTLASAAPDDAAPVVHKKHKHTKRDDDGDRVVRARRKHAKPAAELQPERVALTGQAAEPEETFDLTGDLTGETEERAAEAPMTLHAKPVQRDDGWRVSVGPYLWASSVDANVSVGSANIGAGIDFVKTVQHARYGAELLGEVGHGKFSLTGDFMYGVVGIDGGTAVGPVMLTVNGEVSSLQFDGAAGYRIYGDEHSTFAVEGRVGVRYQRTAIKASVGVLGVEAGPPEAIDTGRDILAGTRVFARPASWFFMTGVADLGLFGTSSSTWSVSADANFNVTSHVMLSLGYRTLTIDRTNFSIVMHGPRAAAELVF